MGKWFGTDGIRGVANVEPMTAELALEVGRAVTRMFRRDDYQPRVVIGKDTRISGYVFEYALVSGICSMGGIAYILGPLPTPGVAFMTRSMRADAGIVISASHNPFEDNGIKVFCGEGRKLPDAREEEIEALMAGGELERHLPDAGRLGKAMRIDDVAGRYIDFLKDTFPRDLTLEGFKIAMDCSNGATYKVAPKTFEELGADVKVIHDEPDGTNINRDCGSEHPEALAERVQQTGADVGLAFDGDGDRLIAVDERGRVVTGDQMIAACALALQAEGRLRNNVVVTTVMSNLGLRALLKERGIRHVAAPVGDRYVREVMDETGAVFGGEDSGHLIFGEHHTTGDGILSALQLVSCMLRAKQPLSELVSVMKVFPQRLINVDVREKPDLDTLPAVRKVIGEAESALGDRGRVLVRYSGTQKLCRVMVEGPTEEITLETCRRIAEAVERELG